MVKLSIEDKKYIQMACKMIPFPVDMKEGAFLVPSDMQNQAEQSIEICHIRKRFDFKIALVIPGSSELNKPFDPKIRLKSARPIIKEGSKIESIKEGDRYTIVSTETVLEVKEATSKNVKLKYIESLKADIVTTREQIEKAISLGTWTEI